VKEFTHLRESQLRDVIDILAHDLDFAVNVFDDHELHLHRFAKDRGQSRAAETACNRAALVNARALHEILEQYRLVLEEPRHEQRHWDDLPF